MTLLSVRLSRRAALILACAAAFVPAAVRAQRPVGLGAYVRIMAPSAVDTLITGTVVEIDSASLRLTPPAPAASRTVAIRDIERLEVWGPGGRMTLAGALLGTAAGALVGYGICHAASGSPHANCPKDEASLVGGMMGLALGALLGSAINGRDRWHPAVAPRR
jgi:hypothetical protein